MSVTKAILVVATATALLATNPASAAYTWATQGANCHPQSGTGKVIDNSAATYWTGSGTKRFSCPLRTPGTASSSTVFVGVVQGTTARISCTLSYLDQQNNPIGGQTITVPANYYGGYNMQFSPRNVASNAIGLTLWCNLPQSSSTLGFSKIFSYGFTTNGTP